MRSRVQAPVVAPKPDFSIVPLEERYFCGTFLADEN